MRRTDIIFWALLLMVCWLPLPFGSVQAWAWSLMVIAAGLLLIAWGVTTAVAGSPTPHGLGRVKWSVVGFLIAGLWGLIQVSTATPAAWHHPIWAIAAETLSVPVAGRIAINPQAAVSTLLRLASYAIIFWLAFQYGRDRRLAHLGMCGVAMTSSIVAALGIVPWLIGWDGFLWFDREFMQRQLQVGARLAIPFVNPNHLASYAGIGLLCGIGVLVGDTRGLWRPETQPREKLRRFLEVVFVRRWYVVAACPILAVAALLSLSRAGIAAIGVGLIVLIAALLRRSRPKVSWLFAGSAVALTAIVGAFAPSLIRLSDRLEQASLRSDQRLEIYRNSMEAIAASPWLGYGLGSFQSLYRMYDHSDLRRVVNAAHSTVLENILELGIPAALALFAAILIPVVGCWRGAASRRQDQHIPAIAVAASIMLILHSLVDFPLQIPALAALFAFVLGLGFAQSISARHWPAMSKDLV
ncbi:O-antigen ligase family protein [Emcibacter sp. SYSU 3D8]|uniref:O-antigen ligase family protein n=1 Tax=Emcibacter sp. SYSU 3D8 TaxID=3133969 RepID=UPI0031FEE4D6